MTAADDGGRDPGAEGVALAKLLEDRKPGMDKVLFSDSRLYRIYLFHIPTKRYQGLLGGLPPMSPSSLPGGVPPLSS